MKKPTFCHLALLPLLLPLVNLIGCAANDRISAVPDTFLQDVDVTKKLENMPFQHSWVWTNVKRKNFSGVYIPAVKTSTLPKDGWERSVSAFITSQQDYQNEASAIATFFRQRLIEELGKTGDKQLRVVNKPGPGIVVFEIALTELEFSHPVSRAASLASPIPGTGAALSAVTDPHAAFAARLTDGGNGELIATAADRKFPPMRIVDLNKLTVTSSAREVTGIWAEELAEALQKGRFGDVESRGKLRLETLVTAVR